MSRKKFPSPINVDEGRWLASIAIAFFVVSSIVIEDGLDGGNQSRCIHRVDEGFVVGDAEITANTGRGSPDEKPFVIMDHRN
jgi:hypothetical protein